MGAQADKLRRAELIEGDLPDAYIDFLETLSDPTIEALISLKTTLKSKHDIEAVPIRVKKKGVPIFAVTKSMPVL
jgi:hypothetical protein